MTNQAITTYIDDHLAPIHDIPFHTDIQSLENMDYNHTIIEFLKRPSVIDKFNITSENTICLTSSRFQNNYLTPVRTFNFPSFN